MKTRKPSEMSDEMLLKQEKAVKTGVYVLSVALLILLLIQIILLTRRGFTATIAIPFALIPIVLVNVRTHKELQAEIKKRNL
ncbi:MAG: hypothetical protein QM743_07605 [Chitinophagaceae bacterium]